MSVTIPELKMLRDVLLMITNLSLSTRRTLHDLSKRQLTSEDRDRINKEVKNIEVSITTTRSLYLFYERRIQEEIEKGNIRRHMEDARALCGAIREMRREERERMDEWQQPKSTGPLGSTIEGKNAAKEKGEVARQRARDLTITQHLNAAPANGECTGAKLRILKVQEEDKENIEETLREVGLGESSSCTDSSTALLHRISTSLRHAVTPAKAGRCPTTTEEKGGAIELVEVGSVSKGSFSRIMKKMSMKGRPPV